MLKTICPRCCKASLILITDGMYKCSICGYIGKSTFNEDVFKK